MGARYSETAGWSERPDVVQGLRRAAIAELVSHDDTRRLAREPQVVDDLGRASHHRPAPNVTDQTSSVSVELAHGELVEAEVKRSVVARVTRIQVGVDQPLRVVVPAGASDEYAREALRAKSDWVRRKLRAVEETLAASAALGLDRPGVVWVRGQSFPVRARPSSVCRPAWRCTRDTCGPDRRRARREAVVSPRGADLLEPPCRRRGRALGLAASGRRDPRPAHALGVLLLIGIVVTQLATVDGAGRRRALRRHP